MNDIDLALPGFLRAANRKPQPQTQERRSDSARTTDNSVGGKSKRRRTKALAEAEVSNDH